MLKHLKALRELPKPAEATLPINLLDLLKPVAGQIFAEGARAEEGWNREHTERLHRLLGDLEAEVDALANINQALEGRWYRSPGSRPKPRLRRPPRNNRAAGR